MGRDRHSLAVREDLHDEQWPDYLLVICLTDKSKKGASKGAPFFCSIRGCGESRLLLLGLQSCCEALRLGNALDLDCDRIDRCLNALEPPTSTYGCQLPRWNGSGCICVLVALAGCHSTRAALLSFVKCRWTASELHLWPPRCNLVA